MNSNNRKQVVLRPGIVTKELAKIYGEGNVVMLRDPGDYYYFVVSDKYPAGIIPPMLTFNLEGLTLERILDYVKDYLEGGHRDHE